MKTFNKISKKEIASAGVRSLPDRPNAYSKYGAGALTATQLKEAFDKLAILISERINIVFDALESGEFSEYIKLPTSLSAEGADSISELLGGLLTGEFANKIQVQDGDSAVSLSNKLFAICRSIQDEKAERTSKDEELEKAISEKNDLEKEFKELAERVEEQSATNNLLVGQSVSRMSYNASSGIFEIISHNGTSHEIDLPLELTVQNGYYDEIEHDIVIVLTSGQEVRIPAGDVSAEAFESRLAELEARFDESTTSQAFANTSFIQKDFDLENRIANEETARETQDVAVLNLCVQSIQNVQAQMVGVVQNEQSERARKDAALQEQIDELKSGSKSYSEGLAWFDVDGDEIDGVIEHFVIITGIGSCTDTDIRIPPTINGWNVRVIASEAFMSNANITSVVLPDSIEKIDSHAFMLCSNLKSVTLNDGLQSIEKAAFAICTSLNDVVIPSSVTFIDESTFDGCSNLKTFTCNGVTPPTITEYTFYGTNIEEYRVLATALETYKTAEYWSAYADKLVPYDTLETLRADIDKLKENGGGNGSGNYDARIADLQAQIATEKTNREAQDNAVLNAAAAAIQQNVVNLSNIDAQLSQAIGNEQTARANKDNDLQAQIDAINETISGFVNVAEVGA